MMAEKSSKLVRQALSLSGPKTVAELAKDTGLNPRTIYRALDDIVGITSHRDGKSVLYGLNENSLPSASVSPNLDDFTLREFNQTMAFEEDPTVAPDESPEEVIEWAMMLAQRFVNAAAAIREYKDHPDWFKLAGG